MADELNLDSPERFSEIRQVIQSKPALRCWYEEIYRSFQKVLAQTTAPGPVIELGSGAGLMKDYLPEVLTTDVISYPGIDRIVDATKMDFSVQSLRAIFMLNVLHHIPDPEAFFYEAERCLASGGRLFIVDQYPGLWAKLILKYAHHEPFDQQAEKWKFPSMGPLSGANGALAWIIFYRDRDQWIQKFPLLELLAIKRHTPLRYWLAGGLKSWSLLPGFLFSLATWLDQILVALAPATASFMSIEIRRK